MTSVDGDLLSRLGLMPSGASPERKNDRLGQADFLKLMVTQLRNQDPFKPLESGEFLGQLAQFATVSGIEDLQRSFQGFTQSIYSGQALQAASLVDRQVMVPVDMAVVDPERGQWGAVEVPVSGSEVVVSVYSGSGALVRQINLGPQSTGLAEFRWDGRNESGVLVNTGIYEFRAVAQGPGRTEALNTLLAARVQSVSVGNRDGSLTLMVEGLGEIDFSRVRRIG